MVVAPNQDFPALSASQYKRRFNVAASRAQDQLWLFHSVTVDRLKRSDLRNSLLAYVTSTSPAPANPMPRDVTPDVRRSEFASLFEQRLFVDLRDRGYHVNPGVEVNNRRIDLVVTGQVSRLAVECDGDSIQSTPERRLADLQREQELKRCGWTFWRVRESEYYLDVEAVLEDLWNTLSALGIEPNTISISPTEAATEEWIPVDLDRPQDDLLPEDAPEDAPLDVPVNVPASNSTEFLDARLTGATASTPWNAWQSAPEGEKYDMWTVPSEAPEERFPTAELPINGYHDGGHGHHN